MKTKTPCGLPRLTSLSAICLLTMPIAAFGLDVDQAELSSDPAHLRIDCEVPGALGEVQKRACSSQDLHSVSKEGVAWHSMPNIGFVAPSLSEVADETKTQSLSGTPVSSKVAQDFPTSVDTQVTDVTEAYISTQITDVVGDALDKPYSQEGVNPQVTD